MQLPPLDLSSRDYLTQPSTSGGWGMADILENLPPNVLSPQWCLGPSGRAWEAEPSLVWVLEMEALKCSVVCWGLARLAGPSGQDTLNLYQDFIDLSPCFPLLGPSRQYPPLTVHGIHQVPKKLWDLHLWGGSWFSYQLSSAVLTDYKFSSLKQHSSLSVSFCWSEV